MGKPTPQQLDALAMLAPALVEATADKPVRRRSDTPPVRQDDALAANVERLRAERGLSGRQLSTAAGLSPDAIRNLRKGRSRSPRARTIQRLADALGVPIQALYGSPPSVPASASVSLVERDAAGKETGRWTLPASALPRGVRPGDYLLVVPDGGSPDGIGPGDRVLVRASEREITGNGIYALDVGGKVRLARLRRVAANRNTVRIEVDDALEAEVVPASQVAVLGRVAAVWGRP